jgi:hypothetical protein
VSTAAIKEEAGLKVKEKACLTGLEEDLSYSGLMRPGPGPCLLLSRFLSSTPWLNAEGA